MKATTIDMLKRLKDKKFDFSSVKDLLGLTNLLLEDIGNTDPLIRDELVYPALARLLYEEHLENGEVEKILKQLFTERFLFYKIGENNTSSVYTRTFSALQIAVVLYKHNEKNFLSEELVKDMYSLFLDYFRREKDVSGYSSEFGWSHSVAHAADVFKQFVICDELNEELEGMLSVVKDKFTQADYLFVNNEDERIVSAIDLLIKRDLFKKDIIGDWIKSFGEYRKETDYKREFVINSNVKNLLRSIYFRNDSFEEVIRDTLFIINPFKK